MRNLAHCIGLRVQGCAGVLLLAVTCASNARANIPGWKEIGDRDGKFHLLMPAAAKRQEDSLPDGGRAASWVGSDGKIMYVVTALVPSTPTPPDQVEDAMIAIPPQLFAGPACKGKVIPGSVLEGTKGPLRLMRWNAECQDGGRIYGLVAAAFGRIYSLAAMARPPQTQQPKSFKSWIDSLTIDP
jgi:hypothetical protein